jgi:hypothetical protein
MFVKMRNVLELENIFKKFDVNLSGMVRFNLLNLFNDELKTCFVIAWKDIIGLNNCSEAKYLISNLSYLFHMCYTTLSHTGHEFF